MNWADTEFLQKRMRKVSHFFVIFTSLNHCQFAMREFLHKYTTKTLDTVIILKCLQLKGLDMNCLRTWYELVTLPAQAYMQESLSFWSSSF